MPSIIKDKQLIRMSGNVVEAVQNYRADIEEDNNETPSANQAINDLILMGYKFHLKNRIHRQQRAQRRGMEITEAAK